MPSLTRDLADFSTSFLLHIWDYPTAPSVRVTVQITSSHFSITEIVYLSMKIGHIRRRLSPRRQRYCSELWQRQKY